MSQSTEPLPDLVSDALQTRQQVYPTYHYEMSDPIPKSSENPALRSPSHRIKTKRLIIRSAVPSDAQAIYDLRSSKANNPHTKVEPDISPEVFAERIPLWQIESLEGTSAFMVITLRHQHLQQEASGSTVVQIDNHQTNNESEVEDEDEGPLIGFGGFNSFTYRDYNLAYHTDYDDRFSAFHRPPVVEGPPVLVGDTGVMIDKAHWRQGYALEAFAATVEYGFDVLGCRLIAVDTHDNNIPWQNLMNNKLGMYWRMARELFGQTPRTERNIWNLLWIFSKEDWERVKDELREKEGRMAQFRRV